MLNTDFPFLPITKESARIPEDFFSPCGVIREEFHLSLPLALPCLPASLVLSRRPWYVTEVVTLTAFRNRDAMPCSPLYQGAVRL